MTRFHLPIVALLLAASSARAAAPAAGIPPAPQIPLKFNHVALGNVVRVLSARYGVPFTLEAKARAPITGDFSKLGLKDAAEAVARQAGLFAQPLGPGPSAGFRLSAHRPAPPPRRPAPASAGPVVAFTPPPAASASAPAPSPNASDATDPALIRAALLQQRALLMQAADQLGH